MRFLILFAVASLALTTVAAEEKKVVCYFGSWSVYRPDAGKFNIDDISPKLCTHLIYTFVGLDGDDVKVLDEWQDLPDNWGKDGFGRFNALREQSPGTKTLVAIGGWNEGSAKYSRMASNPSSRARFVKNVVDFVKKHDFDGFDVDWEYPAQRGGAAADVQNFVDLLKELRTAFDADGLILSAAVGAAASSASQSYNIAEISKYLHFINLMTYDLHGSWESHTGVNAGLYPAKSETGNDRQLNVDAAVTYWLSNGAPASKLVLGTASYGRSFTLADPNSAEIGAPTRGPGAAGPYTREAGMLGYNEICELQNKEQWTVKFDEERRVPYAYRGDQWVGYDNVKSIKEKAEYIMKMGLGGAMVWSIETDDFRGVCGEKFPLLNTLNHVLRDGKEVFGRSTQPPRATHAPVAETTTLRPSTDSHNDDHSSSNSGSFKCTAPGNYPNPETCESFFQCAQTHTGFQQFTIPCPDGLCYKSKTGICDWK